MRRSIQELVGVILFASLIIFGGIYLNPIHTESAGYDSTNSIDIQNQIQTAGYNLSDYEHIDYIFIDSDSALQSTASLEGWSGNGSESAPYIIEGYFIQSASTAIDISYTSLHFIITNCIVATLATDFPDWNLEFEYVDFGTVTNSYFYGDVGIKGGRNGALVFQNNTMIDQSITFSVTDSLHFIRNNISSGSLTIRSTDYCNVTSNLIGGSLTVDSSPGSIIHSNVLNAEFTQFLITGMDPDEWRHDIWNNTLNGQPMLYLKDIANETYSVGSDYAQVILGVCDNVTITNGLFVNNPTAVMIGLSTNCSVIDSTFIASGWSIRTEGCKDLYIDHNYFKSNTAAISSFDTEKLHISNNEIDGHKPYPPGYWPQYESQGTGIFSQSNCVDWTINNNRITNTRYGIRTTTALDFNITENVICNNLIGFNIGTSSGFSIFSNRIGWNEDQAQDESSPGSNQWDDGVSVGNYWSDYSGVGVYEIPGSSNSVDNYPMILVDDIGPNITLTQDPTIVNPGEEVNITARIHDNYGVDFASVVYTIIVGDFVNDNILMKFNGSVAEKTIGTFWDGEHVTFIVNASDWAGNEESATISFIVGDDNTGSTETTTTGTVTDTGSTTTDTNSNLFSLILPIGIGIGVVSIVVIIVYTTKIRVKTG